MAIPFLNNINLSDNELQNAKLHVTSTAPTAAAAQIYFDSTPSDLTAKYYSNSTDLWVSLKEYAFPTGNYVTGTVTGTTPKPIITFDLNAVDGTAVEGERYLTKNNTWATVASIPGTYTFDIEGDTGGAHTVSSGSTLELFGGTYISTDSYSGAGVTFNHDSTSRTDTTSTDAPGYGGTFEAVTSVTTNATGHVTAIDVSTVTIPASADTTYDLEGVGSTNGTAGVRLSGSDATNDDVLIVGAGTTTVTRSGNTLTVTSNDQFTGTVTSVDAGITGDALSISGVPFTTSGSIDFSWDGAATDYVDGEGNLQPFPTIPTVPTNIVETFSNNNTGTYVAYGVTNTGATGNVNIGEVDLTAVDGTAVSGERYLTKSNTWAEVASIYDWDIQGDSGGPTTVTSGDVIDIAGGTNVTTALSGTTLTINSTDEFTGTLTGITEGPGITVTPSATSPTVAVDYLGSDNYLLEAGVATVASSEDIINFSDDTDSNVKKTTLGTIPVNSLTLVKNYIDSSVSGGVYYQGGYNPTTDLTSPGNYGLQTPPNPNIIEIGWMYTVTADGTFFGEQVRVGDVLIAEIDAPTSLSDWTTVQNNIDLASDLQVGLGNVVPGSSNTITAPYSSGTATLDVVDSSPTQKGAVIVDAGTGISVSYASGTATVTNTQTNSANTYAETITDTDLTIDHNLGTKDVIVQLYDVTTDETVYADVERISTSRIGVTFSATPTNSVRVLVQKIG